MLTQLDHINGQCFLTYLLTLVLLCHLYLLLYLHVVLILICFCLGSFYPKHISMSVNLNSMGSCLGGHTLCLLHTCIVQTTSQYPLAGCTVQV